MKRLIFIFIIGIFFTSCAPSLKRCSKAYPPKIIIKDSIVYKTSVEYNDTTIYVYVKADTVYSTKDSLIKVYIDNNTGLINSDTSKLSNDLATAYAWVNDGILEQMLIRNDSIYQFKLDSAIKTTNEYWNNYHSEIKVEKVYAIHWYDTLARYISISFISGLFIVFIIKFIKSYFII